MMEETTNMRPAMIGADESTLCNYYGSVIIVRRGPGRDAEVAAYRAMIERLGIDMKLPADDIRRAVWNAERRG